MTEIKRKIRVIGINSFKFEDLPLPKSFDIMLKNNITTIKIVTNDKICPKEKIINLDPTFL